MTSPDRNIEGYVKLISHYFDLYTSEEIEEMVASRTIAKQAGLQWLRAHDGRFVIPYREIKPLEIINEWDRDGSKRLLGDKLGDIQADQERLDRLMNAVDESMRWIPREDAVRMSEHYRLNQPDTDADGFKPTKFHAWWSVEYSYRRAFEWRILKELAN